MNTKKSIKNNIRSLDFQEAKNVLGNYEYSLIYEISEVIFGQTPRESEIDWNQVQEGWFFGEKGQLHIYREDNVLLAVQIEDAALPDVHMLEKTYYLTGKFQTAGKQKIVVREYIDFDEDGQSYVAYTRLLRLV